ncbi:hypothetical protein ACFX11_041716 [Malus domestica]
MAIPTIMMPITSENIVTERARRPRSVFISLSSVSKQPTTGELDITCDVVIVGRADLRVSSIATYFLIIMARHKGSAKVKKNIESAMETALRSGLIVLPAFSFTPVEKRKNMRPNVAIVSNTLALFIQERFQDPQNDPSLSDIHDPALLPDVDALFDDVENIHHSPDTQAAEEEEKDLNKELISLGLLKWRKGRPVAEAPRYIEKAPKIVNVKVSARAIQQQR